MKPDLQAPEAAETAPVFTIRVASQLSGVTASTIREYERQGLLKPYRIPNSNHRLFSRLEVMWIRNIWRLLHQEGLNVKGIRRLMCLDPCWKVLRCLPQARETCTVAANGMPCWTQREHRGCCQPAEVACQSCTVYIRSQRRPELVVKGGLEKSWPAKS